MRYIQASIQSWATIGPPAKRHSDADSLAGRYWPGFYVPTEIYVLLCLFQWDLICDRAWIPATMLTIQIIFQLFGNFFAGQIADTIGRKIPFFSSIVLIMIFSVVCYFSTSWIMFLVSRIFIGIGCGLFLTTQYSYLSEFTLARWRAWLIGFPSWPMQTCLMALVLWLLKDWRNFHLVCALMGIPFLATWW